ncbi:hypothetical protein NPIL_336551 [Nephila pilipes]|uniref:Uncharacterized protein n=1 Tax=Nephila pilipes TaxID=299642 RepID=A0A8X6NJY5_NEPPI|nr:hypothetical protein NPIL_336551 [Nephila pilipes]
MLLESHAKLNNSPSVGANINHIRLARKQKSTLLPWGFQLTINSLLRNQSRRRLFREECTADLSRTTDLQQRNKNHQSIRPEGSTTLSGDWRQKDPAKINLGSTPSFLNPLMKRGRVVRCNLGWLTSTLGDINPLPLPAGRGWGAKIISNAEVAPGLFLFY